MIKSTREHIVDYLTKKQGYISKSELFNAMTFGGGANVKSYRRAIQDLTASGRIVNGIEDHIRINL